MLKEWTDEDVARAIQLIKIEDPDLWDRYIEQEKTTANIDGEDWIAMTRLIWRLRFPNCSLSELTVLKSKMRDKVRSDLGLEPV